jgi:hypothetical protein
MVARAVTVNDVLDGHVVLDIEYWTGPDLPVIWTISGRLFAVHGVCQGPGRYGSGP